MDERCVVFYDSGSGGKRLFEKTRKAFPFENYVYYADEKNLPFGDKTQVELKEIFQSASRVIASFCPKLLVVACNTMSLAASDIFSSLPYDVVCVRPKLPEKIKTNKSSGDFQKNEKWLILTTVATSKNDWLKRVVNVDPRLTVSPLKGLADEVEQWIKGGKKPDVSLNFANYDKDFDYVSLGCTHYGYLTEDLKKIFPKAKIVSGEELAFEQITLKLNTFNYIMRKGNALFVKS